MTNKLMTGEEIYEALKAAGWVEWDRVKPRMYDPNDYIFVMMRLRGGAEDSEVYVRLRSEWTSDKRAIQLNEHNMIDWNSIPEHLKWPTEIAEVMKFCS